MECRKVTVYRAVLHQPQIRATFEPSKHVKVGGMRRLQTIWRLLIGKSPRISHVNGCLKSFDGIAPDSSWDHRSQDGQVSLWDVQDEPPSFPPWIPIKRNETLPVPCILQLQVFDGVFFFHFWRLTTFLEFLPDQWSIHIDTNHQRLVWFPRYAVPSPHLILFSICIHWYLYSLYIFQWFCH